MASSISVADDGCGGELWLCIARPSMTKLPGNGIDTNTLNSFHLHTIFNFDVVSSTTNTTREIYLMADFLPPSGPPPPKVPEGWKAVWNEQYKEW